VLSQHTSSVNCRRAFGLLKERFPTWEEAAGAPVEHIARAIRPGGIANVKASRIKGILEAIRQSEGRLDLSRLDQLDSEEVDSYLRTLPGVGPKTAACVQLFSLGRPAMPVDTHIHRVARRLGVVDEAASPETTQRALERAVATQSAEVSYELHVLLIRHGRDTCRPTRPRCSSCPLLDVCDAGPGYLRDGVAR
jgi:endonuclease-3